MQCTYSSCTGSAEAVVAFWQALGFQVAYDIVREGVTATCHSNGFAINARWCQVLVPAPLATLMHCITIACTCYTVPSLLHPCLQLSLIKVQCHHQASHSSSNSNKANKSL